MLLHLCLIREYLGTDASFTNLAQDWQAISGFFLSEIDEENLGCIDSFLWIKVEGIQNIVDAVCTKRDADTAQSWKTEDARQVVISTTTSDATHRCVQGFDLEDCTSVVVQTTCQRQVELDLILQAHGFQGIEDKFSFLYALQSGFRSLKNLGDNGKFFLVASRQRDNRLQLLDGFLANAIRTQFLIDIFQTNLVELVNGHGNVHDLVCLTDNLGDTCQNLAVVDFDANSHTELREDGIDNLHQFDLIQQGIGTNDIGIALVELAVTTFLRTVGTPHRLDLITLERHLQFLTMLYDVTCERHGQVVAKTLLTQFGGEFQRTERMHIFIGNLAHVVS